MSGTVWLVGGVPISFFPLEGKTEVKISPGSASPDLNFVCFVQWCNHWLKHYLMSRSDTKVKVGYHRRYLERQPVRSAILQQARVYHLQSTLSSTFGTHPCNVTKMTTVAPNASSRGIFFFPSVFYFFTTKGAFSPDLLSFPLRLWHFKV